MQILFSLANTTDRMLRLLQRLSDQGNTINSEAELDADYNQAAARI